MSNLDNVKVWLSQLNNSVIFGGKPKGPERFLNRMIEDSGIIIERCLNNK